MLHHPYIKTAADVGSAGLAFASVLANINAVVSLLAAAGSLVWTGIRLYEWYKEKKSADRK